MLRVRCAWSPSGDIHLGNIRTILFNHFFARHEGGAFIWRVEDTNAEKAKPEMVDRARETFEWLGIDWDEGPYYQSQRGPYYAEVIERLLASGSVYRCYCTKEDLARRNVTSGYDRFCRTRADQPDAPFALRFAVPERDVVIVDLLKGEIRRPFTDMQDFVVQRTDGSQPFILANTADDIAMGITHVMRGEDLLPAAFQNALLFDALGAPRPSFVHLPLMLGPDRSRLGARHGAVGTLSYRDAGYLPEALVNYLALLGWSPGTGEELMSRERIVELFSLDGLQKSNAVFDVNKLNWMNQEYIKTLPAAELESRILAIDDSIPRDILRQALEMQLLQTRITTLAQVRDDMKYLYERPAVKVENADETLSLLASKLGSLDPWSVDGVRDAVRSTIEELGLHRRKGPKPIFLAISGSERALPLFESIYIIGKDEAVTRLRAAIG